jgi:CheY-like chemotaxis protein
MLEGDRDDRYITQQTLSELTIDISVKFLSDSTEFFTFLSNTEKPTLILVAYNSTPENGPDVLKKLKSDPTLSDIPVIILSDSDHPKCKNKCHKYGASSFIKKPDTAEATNKKIDSFFTYWCDVVEV